MGSEAHYAKKLTNASKKTFFLKFLALLHYISTTNENFVISVKNYSSFCWGRLQNFQLWCWHSAKVHGFQKKIFFVRATEKYQAALLPGALRNAQKSKLPRKKSESHLFFRRKLILWEPHMWHKYPTMCSNLIDDSHLSEFGAPNYEKLDENLSFPNLVESILKAVDY